MLLRIDVGVTGGNAVFRKASRRYQTLATLRRAEQRSDARVLGFGFEQDRLRLLVAGGAEEAASITRRLKVGLSNLARADGLPWRSEHTWRTAEPGTVLDGLRWCHQAVASEGAHDPLSSPWSSYRDLMGYRRAAFFDPEPTWAVVERAQIHDVSRAGPLPAAPDTPPHLAAPDGLWWLQRVAGAVNGVLPSDRACFATFAHLASVCGASRRDVAERLRVGDRRVRQLLQHDTEVLLAAVTALVDPRLAAVP